MYYPLAFDVFLCIINYLMPDNMSKYMNITAVTEDEFRKQFRVVLQRDECTTINNIVYFWMSENPIPRVSGESNILYIGQTSRSLNGRYSSKNDFEIEVAYFNRFYRHIIQKYGAVYLDVKEAVNPKFSEWEELAKYYCTHLEYPPLNRAVPSKPVTCTKNA